MPPILAQHSKQDPLAQLAEGQNIPSKSNNRFVRLVWHTIPMNSQRQYDLLAEINTIFLDVIP